MNRYNFKFPLIVKDFRNFSKTKVLFRKNHLFHIVEPTLIPFSLFPVSVYFAISLIYWFHSYTSNFFSLKLAILLVLSVISYWFSYLVNESKDEFIYTRKVEENFLFGFKLFIISEIMLFFSFFWAFFHSSLVPSIFIGQIWPPVGITPINPWGIPLANTFLLLTSGITVNSFYFHLRAWDSRNMLGYSNVNQYNVIITDSWNRIYLSLVLTLILGLLFLLFQLYEYITAPFTISDGIYGSTFYMTTGLHGLHVFVGFCMLVVCFCRLLMADFSKPVTLRFPFSQLSKTPIILIKCSVWYWHFVDIVWVFLYLSVYIWGS